MTPDPLAPLARTEKMVSLYLGRPAPWERLVPLAPLVLQVVPDPLALKDHKDHRDQ